LPGAGWSNAHEAEWAWRIDRSRFGYHAPGGVAPDGGVDER
jgi:hypothetical protein